MNVHHVLFFCFLSALCDGDSGLVSANTELIHTEGSSMTVACHFTLSGGRRKFLCKDECKEEEDILVETEGERAQSGRFSLWYEGGTFPLTSTVLHVSIAQLTKSDSGRYRCGLERPFLPDSYSVFEITVTDALQTVPEALKQQTEASAAVHSIKGYVLPLLVCVTVFVLFAVVVLLLFKLKTSLNTRGQSDDRNMESTTFERSSPISRCEASSNHRDKFYSNL
ncbi:uncharacterized protein LOC131971076 isoform X2 [Centropristis striata]|uniref:uncharacterized protein LOC131971076 isoform X2 n=1 Tax=Centropristis striata TaxID=184440 RepID=UPI0027E1317D|nr:uncharacterized protein LOC131971076 isoform X2 [Centropristis striata]